MQITVHEDHWQGSGSTDTAYETSDPAAAEASIARLDGQTRTSVWMSHGADVLCIGGGNDGRYMAFFAHNIDEALFNLIDPKVPDQGPELRIITGGQAGTCAPRACLDIATVVVAARHFVETGERAPSLHWAPG